MQVDQTVAKELLNMLIIYAYRIAFAQFLKKLPQNFLNSDSAMTSTTEKERQGSKHTPISAFLATKKNDFLKFLHRSKSFYLPFLILMMVQKTMPFCIWKDEHVNLGYKEFCSCFLKAPQRKHTREN